MVVVCRGWVSGPLPAGTWVMSISGLAGGGCGWSAAAGPGWWCGRLQRMSLTGRRVCRREECGRRRCSGAACLLQRTGTAAVKYIKPGSTGSSSGETLGQMADGQPVAVAAPGEQRRIGDRGAGASRTLAGLAKKPRVGSSLRTLRQTAARRVQSAECREKSAECRPRRKEGRAQQANGYMALPPSACLAAHCSAAGAPTHHGQRLSW